MSWRKGWFLNYAFCFLHFSMLKSITKELVCLWLCMRTEWGPRWQPAKKSLIKTSRLGRKEGQKEGQMEEGKEKEGGKGEGEKGDSMLRCLHQGSLVYVQRTLLSCPQACSLPVNEGCFTKTLLVRLTEQPSGSCYQRTEIKRCNGMKSVGARSVIRCPWLGGVRVALVLCRQASVHGCGILAGQVTDNAYKEPWVLVLL